jgi:hypothetical protein
MKGRFTIAWNYTIQYALDNPCKTILWHAPTESAVKYSSRMMRKELLKRGAKFKYFHRHCKIVLENESVIYFIFWNEGKPLTGEGVDFHRAILEDEESFWEEAPI